MPAFSRPTDARSPCGGAATLGWVSRDRKARFAQTAERHAWLSQFAAPVLTRMTFVDEQGEGTSPTWSALRVSREHRAAGRRGLPPDAPLDFAPTALQRDRPLPLGTRGVPQGPRRDPEPATSPSTARSTSAASRRSSGRARRGSRSATRSGRALDSPSIPTRRSSN